MQKLLLLSAMLFMFLQVLTGCSDDKNISGEEIITDAPDEPTKEEQEKGNAENPEEGNMGNQQETAGQDTEEKEENPSGKDTQKEADEKTDGNQGNEQEQNPDDTKEQNPDDIQGENLDDTPREFVHPGILNSAQELDLMKRFAVGEAACEPWASAYGELLDLVASYYDTDSSNYINMAGLGTTRIVRSNCGGWNDMRVAASKVYNLSIAYHISGNTRYAETAREVMMHYAEQFEGVGSKTDGGGLYDCNLAVGVIAVKFCSAAEVLRYSGYEGWGEADTQTLIDMFNRNTNPDAICSMARLLDWTNDEDGLMLQYDMNNLAHGHAAFANFGAIAYAVFAEDATLYNRVVRTICADVSADYRPAEHSWTRKPREIGTGGAVAYNINPVTGQNKEMDRDLTHSNVMVSGLVTIAQVAYHQGDNRVYECHDRLLLKGVECLAKYNLGYDVEHTSEYPWNHHSRALSTYNRGGAILKDPMYEAAYNYYFYHSQADKEDLVYLQELVNNQTLSPESISEDVSGMGTLLYSDEDRKNVYAEMGDTIKNTETEIFAGNYTALVENAQLVDGDIVVTGNEAGAIAYRTPDWEAGRAPTRELGIALSSNTTGYVEFRLQSKDGKRYGQSLESITEAGNTGSLLARIEVPDTNGETVYLKGTVYDTDGNYGGKLVKEGSKQILYIVVIPDTPDGTIRYSKLTTRPDESYVLAGGESDEEGNSGEDEVVINGLQNAGVAQLYSYGWNGSGVDFSKYTLNGWDDQDLEGAFTDANGNSICPGQGIFGADCYLIFDLGEKKSLGSFQMVTSNPDTLSDSWAVYGANELDKFESTWTLLAKSSEMELVDNTIEVAVNGKYRYIMIGGYGTGDKFMDTWVHCWDYMTEIQ